MGIRVMGRVTLMCIMALEHLTAIQNPLLIPSIGLDSNLVMVSGTVAR